VSSLIKLDKSNTHVQFAIIYDIELNFTLSFQALKVFKPWNFHIKLSHLQTCQTLKLPDSQTSNFQTQKIQA